MKRDVKIGITLLIIVVVVHILTLPRSPGNFYVPSRYYNLFLPEFGQNKEISILPHMAKTVLGMYALNGVLLTLLGGDIMLLHSIYHVISPILTFLSFYILLNSLNFQKKVIIVSGFLSIIFPWSSIFLILGVISMLPTLMQDMNKKFMIASSLSFTTLLLYWHSGHMLFFVIILSVVLFKTILSIPSTNGGTKYPRLWYFTLFLTVISALVWIWVRELYGHINVINILEYFQLRNIYQGMFSKGSFVSESYQYQIEFGYLSKFIDSSKYVMYLIVIISVLYLSLKSLIDNNLNFNWRQIMGIPLVFGSFVFVFLYYLATYTFGPLPFMVFLIPYFLGVTINGKLKNRIWNILLFFVVACLLISWLWSTYTLVTTNPEFNQDFDIFHPPTMWIAMHSDKVTLLSDADTLGYCAIWYGKDRLYDSVSLYWRSIGNRAYIKLYGGNYLRDGSVMMIYNFDIFEKNLVFESLQAWNKYKPLPPIITIKNTLNIVYSSGKIWILN